MKVLFSIAALAALGGVATSAPSKVVAGYNTSCAIDTGALTCWGDNSSGQLGIGSVDSSAHTTPLAVSGMSSGVTYVSVAIDGGNVCAVKAGALYCWGNNTYGQIGDGTTGGTHSTPTAVSGLSSGVTQVAASSDHTCAVGAGGQGFCWGDNTYGQLGNNHLSNPIIPTAGTPFYSTSGVTQYSVGQQFTCAVMLDINGSGYKDVRCWGRNDKGQAGNTSFTPANYPAYQTIAGSATSNVTVVSAGFDHACALAGSSGQKPYCWGTTNFGQVGNGGTGSPYNSPQAVVTSNLFAEISAGVTHTCGSTTTGTGYCWGDGSHHQLDTYLPVTAQSTPLSLQAGHLPSTSISAGGSDTCFLHASAVVCLGLNTTGQLGNGSTTETTGNPTLPTLTTYRKTAAGIYNSCAITTAGALYCWGDNAFGQLADGTFNDSLIPLLVPGMSSGVTDVSVAGDGYTICAVKASKLYCWGDNIHGEIGDGTTTDRHTPTLVNLPFVARVATSGFHTCALAASPTLDNTLANYCWGDNSAGQLGQGNTTSLLTPTMVVNEGSGLTDIATNRKFTCTLRGGSVYCFGRNDFGQLANGGYVDSSSEGSALALNTTATRISTAWDHACALLVTGAVQCWGNNTNGQCGDNTNGNNKLAPVFIGPNPGSGTAIPAVDVAAGGDATCVTTNSATSLGGLFCFGWNGHGQLGVGKDSCIGKSCPRYNDRKTPALVTNSIAVSDLAMGGFHGLGLFHGSPLTLRSWGDNTAGQIGNGTLVESGTPTITTAPSGGW